MTGLFRIAGRLYGRTRCSKRVSVSVKAAGKYVLAEMKVADVHLRVAFLKRKLQAHHTLLGRTAYRLARNQIDSMRHDQTLAIIRTIGEIESEIADAEEELSSRRAEERAKYE